MTESKTNFVTIRVPDSLVHLLKDEQYAQRKRGDREQSYGELLDAAWNTAHTRLSSPEANTFVLPHHGKVSPVPSVPVSKGMSPKTAPDGANVFVSVSEDELPWVNRLLAVLRSNKKIIISAIKHNLNAFALFLTGAAVDEQPALDDAEADTLGQALQDIAEQAPARERDTDALIAEHDQNRRVNPRNRKRAG